jgi:hypothetical protein
MTMKSRLYTAGWLLIMCGGVGITGSVASSQTIADKAQPSAGVATPTTRAANPDNLEAASGDITARRDRVMAELKSLADQKDLPADHWARQWAGTYYVGDGLGMNVSITVAPKSGIVYTWSGCLGLYDGNHGDVLGTFDDDGDGKPDGLKVKWALQLQGGYHFDSEKYYFVRWTGPQGSPGRFYLVPEAQMIKVVNNYNQGGYARNGMYHAPRKYDRSGGEDPHAAAPPVVGVPLLPPKWAKMLITAAVDAKVTSVTPGATKKVTDNVDGTEARVTLDKGRADGLYLGMEVQVGDLMSDSGSLTIDTLDEHTAGGAFRAFDTADRPIAVPAVGQVIRMSEGAGKKRDGK